MSKELLMVMEAVAFPVVLMARLAPELTVSAEARVPLS